MKSVLGRIRPETWLGCRGLLELRLRARNRPLHIPESSVDAEHQRCPTCAADRKMVRVGNREAEKIRRRPRNRHRRQVSRLERKAKRSSNRNSGSTEDWRQRRVLAFLCETRARLLDRGIRLGNVFTLESDPQAGGGHNLRDARPPEKN